ncbi:bifunctional glutamate N-acetyltransferase/amino-acid acetyltransferase ArgJ [Thermosulfurimonas sp.]|uniref:bifunctional glutamate N-acetyltransferase/amino-acid acetyltransferase ArgJ n=1 Tax=Thermosulfurimonas sp. TaxID=2080236 RepID=UPI0025FC629D|nr:bifunctional glutamate N-acetyltransferase/amino-acid acetyltransferase ArgJ [Thermosulfurimonas sp.]
MFVPKGFLFSAVEAGIKYPGRPDLGLILSEVPAAWAGVFTRNDFKAAPVLLGQKRLEETEFVRAILVNSGCANACTGPEGISDAREILADLAQNLGILPQEILPASTGVIGTRLPVSRIKERLPELVSGLSPDKAALVARAMMTTDTFPKVVSREVPGTGAVILGLAKGAGMIAPNMATMLAFLLTDAGVAAESLRRLLPEAVKQSFNRITVDGDTSTNDTVYLLANGRAGALPREAEEAFRETLFEVCRELSYLIVKDGEGATKVVRIRVEGARDAAEAERLARAVADSPLVKTAFFGEDPNWGRILVALGKLGLGLDPQGVEILVNQVPLVREGQGLSEEEARREMGRPEFTLRIRLSRGRALAELLTCDLSYEYIKINAEYRT